MNYYVKIYKDERNDIEYSKVYIDWHKIFYSKNFKYIYNDNQIAILNEKNFDKKFSHIRDKLRDLTNNAKYYYKYPDKVLYCFNNNYNNDIMNFSCFRMSFVDKIVYLYGPKRSLKTTFLLNLITSIGICTHKVYTLISIIWKI